ncbi:M48 family metallopeptidase [Crocinitomix sp.]|nr:M48 family metallopeptidase [Crocinitomix sp.]
MIRIFGLTILCFVMNISFAQSINDFKALRSSGKVPADFTTKTTDKYETDLKANKDGDLDKDFFLSTRFFIDELLLSGRILFNEKLSNYLNRVAKYTLRSESKLYDELRFYVLKSTSVNAFSTDQGIIVFTTGLFAQLENEAQLAYIIAHEVSHYTEHHVRESYVERQSLRKGRGKYQRLDYDSRISELSIYNKSNELEADKKGIEFFMKTEYDINQVFTSFEMLLYSYLPFNEMTFDSTFFSTDILQIPGTFFPDTLNEIKREKNYDDLNSSHPNVEKRMDAAFEYIGAKKTRGELKFKISEEQFREAQNLARFEGINLLLAEREYGRALYNIFLLNKEFPNNRFLDLSYVKALYALAKYKNANRYREITEKPKNIEGESFVLHLFLDDVSREQLNVIAYRHAYDMALKYPNDKIFKRYEQDMKKELAVNSRISFEELKGEPYSEYILNLEEKVIEFDIADSIAKVEASDLSKYQKIRLKKQLTAMETDLESGLTDSGSDYYIFGLHDLVQNHNLIQELEAIRKEYNAAEEAEIEQEKLNEEEGLGIDNIVVVDPIFEQYRLNNRRDLKKSEGKKIDMTSMYSKTYPELGIRTQLIDSKLLDTKGVDEYNEIGIVFQWLEEVMNHDEIEMISSMSDQMEAVKTKYGTDHFMFTGVFAYKERHEASVIHFYSILFFYTIPIAIADLLVIHHNFELVAFSINAASDQIEFVTVDDVNLRAQPRVLEAYIYDVLYQLNHKKK